MTALELSPTILASMPRAATSETPISLGQCRIDTQSALAEAGNQQRVVPDHTSRDAQSPLAWDDSLLYSLAISLDDLEQARVAAENRFRQLARNQPDSDGKERGGGLTPDHPVFQIHQELVTGLVALEKALSLALSQALRNHPLHPWVKGTIGVGEKQAARLLAAIGDPYIRPELNRDGVVEPSRPRTVSELWAYCGLHVLPVDHRGVENHQATIDGQSSAPTDHNHDKRHLRDVGGGLSGGDPGHQPDDIQTGGAGVAPRRQRGQKINWSTDAKTRAYLIAEKCTTFDGKPDKNGNPRPLSPYRAVYDDRKQHTLAPGRTHVEPCRRCGPKGSPAEVGSPWSQAHHHADALRVTSKEILKDLWRAARAAHGVAD